MRLRNAPFHKWELSVAWRPNDKPYYPSLHGWRSRGENFTRARHWKIHSFCFARVLGASCLACEFYKFPSTTGFDLSSMEDTYHRPDQKTLQALKDMANKLRIDSIESTNTAGSGYVQYAVILMPNFAAWFNSQVAFKLPDFIFQTSVFVLFYGWNNVGSFLPYHALQRWALVMLLVLSALSHLKPCERDVYWAILS